MLIIPMTNKINWKNPPVITIAIILINVLVFFIFQRNDIQAYLTADTYYFESGLAKIEIPYYLDYLKSTGQQGVPDSTHLSPRLMAKYHYYLESDYDFLEELKKNRIIDEEKPVFEAWEMKRGEYDRLINQSIAFRFGFKPAYFSFLTLFTSMFLHGGLGHLVGNMIFLWLVGCIIEAGCGRFRYAVSYLFGGACATLLFKVIYFYNTMPLVGASGAIAGLMGMLAVLFGKSRVKVFYSLGVFFDYIKIRAYFLFILWLGKELVQLFFLGGISNVAYVAHIGGILAGGMTALVLLKIPNAVDQDIFKEDAKDRIGPMIEDALEKTARLDLQGGVHILNKALAIDPENQQVLNQLFKVYKQTPGKQAFHDVAEKIILLLIKKKQYLQASDLFREYKAAVTSVRLPPNLLLKLCFVWCELERPEMAAALIMQLIKGKVNTPGIPAALFKISAAYKAKGNIENYSKCRDFICSNYPRSNEAALILKHGVLLKTKM